MWGRIHLPSRENSKCSAFAVLRRSGRLVHQVESCKTFQPHQLGKYRRCTLRCRVRCSEVLRSFDARDALRLRFDARHSDDALMLIVMILMILTMQFVLSLAWQLSGIMSDWWSL